MNPPETYYAPPQSMERWRGQIEERLDNVIEDVGEIKTDIRSGRRYLIGLTLGIIAILGGVIAQLAGALG